MSKQTSGLISAAGSPRELQLRWLSLDSGGWELETRLNGTRLVYLVGLYEKKYTTRGERDLLHGYGGLQDLDASSLYGWMNEEPPSLDSDEDSYEYSDDDYDEKATLLGCTCGIASCWPLLARVKITRRYVLWHDFEQPHRSETWSYHGFGPFLFHRKQYEDEVWQAIKIWQDIEAIEKSSIV